MYQGGQVIHITLAQYSSIVKTGSINDKLLLSKIRFRLLFARTFLVAGAGNRHFIKSPRPVRILE